MNACGGLSVRTYVPKNVDSRVVGRFGFPDRRPRRLDTPGDGLRIRIVLQRGPDAIVERYRERRFRPNTTG